MHAVLYTINSNILIEWVGYDNKNTRMTPTGDISITIIIWSLGVPSGRCPKAIGANKKHNKKEEEKKGKV